MKTHRYIVLVQVEDTDTPPTRTAIAGALEVGMDGAPKDLGFEAIRDYTVLGPADVTGVPPEEM